MEQKYKYLEYHGRCIFNAVYDAEPKAEGFQTQELIKELLQIFQAGVLSIVKETGEVPDMTTLLHGVRTPILNGIFTEAKELSENQKRVTKGTHEIFPIRNAVNTSREKIESILSTFAAKGTDAAVSYINRLLKESKSEASMFKTQAEEALKKHRESEESRKKTNQRLAEATRKFQANRRMLLEQQTVLESEKTSYIFERDKLAHEIDRITKETTRTIRRNRDLETILEEKNAALETANQKIKETEALMQRGEKAREALRKVDSKLQTIAKNGNTGPERLVSILSELEQLRKQEEEFQRNKTGYAGLVRRYEESKAINEALVLDLEKQKRLTRQAQTASILEGNINTDESVLGGYYHVLEEYFMLSLKESLNDFKNDTLLEGSVKKVREYFFLVRSRGLDPIELGEEKLKTIEQSLRARNDLSEYGIANFTIGGVRREVMSFLHSLIQNHKAVSAYVHMAKTGRRESETVI